MDTDRIALLSAAKRVVVKIGSNVLTRDNGLNLDAIRSISAQVCRLMESGRSVILVSSGAMAAGLGKLSLRERPEYTPARQAVSAVGQAGLIREYEKAFAGYGRQVAQLLLTAEDMNSRKRYLNARNALNTLLSWEVVPIINENDTVMVEEIQFGDNDNLSAVIALLMDADALINLTDIDGLYTKDPRQFPDADLIGLVHTIGKNIERLASGIPGALGTGGMLSKIRAARKVTEAGLPMIIAKGHQEGILDQLFAGEPEALFLSRKPDGFRAESAGSVLPRSPKERSGSTMVPPGPSSKTVKAFCQAALRRWRGIFASAIRSNFKTIVGMSSAAALSTTAPPTSAISWVKKATRSPTVSDKNPTTRWCTGTTW